MDKQKEQRVFKPKLVIWGASGHAKVIADILKLRDEFQIVGFLDDVNIDHKGKSFLGFPILGGREKLDELVSTGVEYLILGFGECHSRLELAGLVRSKGLRFTSAIHPRSIIARDVSIGEGSVIVAGAVVNPGSRLGEQVIINTCASVGHDCTIHIAAHIAPGVRIGGCSTVGLATWIGIGAVINDHVRIGNNCIIGAGSVVLKDLPDNVIAYGVPARIIRNLDFDETQG